MGCVGMLSMGFYAAAATKSPRGKTFGTSARIGWIIGGVENEKKGSQEGADDVI